MLVRKTATRIILGLLGLVALALLLDGMAAVFQPTFEPGDARPGFT
jgi:hypothetical protein